ncbi:DUF1415 domain-containing protein [Eleftheria terrae]|uniref:DUF1415 domain-containing protein n=1 Tax=Eleftheria terrae TaxID=1597781 RepID=UPI00263A8784|nr:DUF1415 domain-containing protein [Eleftheria terrae]WKB55363.1 DUF1415 domain-containing protein [Eleftheria terrae]
MSELQNIDNVVAEMRRWVDRAVIGLNLCPFAKAVAVKGQIRYVVSSATTPRALLDDLRRELLHLAAVDPGETDTTLLVLPGMLEDFLDFNDFLADADDLLASLELVGELQIADFHPRYQFAGTAEDDIENYTNRAPYPTLHLLREASIDRAVEAFPEAEAIYEANMQTLRRLGRDGWERLMSKGDAE